MQKNRRPIHRHSRVSGAGLITLQYLDDVFPALIQKLATHTSPDPHNELKLLQDEIWSFINTVGRLQGTLVNAAMFVCLRLIYDIGNGCTAVAPGKDLDAMIAGIATEMGKPSMITALTSFGGGGRLEVFMRPPAGIRGA